MNMTTLQDLFMDQLQEMYDVEKRLVKALPKMAAAAGCEELRQGFQEHLEQTRHQVERLENVFELIGSKAKAKTSYAMKGLIEEGEEIIRLKGEVDVRDAGLIAAGQKVEHFEIASYGCLCTWAQQLGHQDAQHLLHESLEEEKQTDAKLTDIAERHVNMHAAHA